MRMRKSSLYNRFGMSKREQISDMAAKRSVQAGRRTGLSLLNWKQLLLVLTAGSFAAGTLSMAQSSNTAPGLGGAASTGSSTAAGTSSGATDAAAATGTASGATPTIAPGQKSALLRIIQKCDEAIAANNKDFKAYVDRAHAFYELGNYGLCAQDLTWALQLDGSDPRWYVWRAKAYLKAGNTDAALADCNSVLKGDANNMQALIMRASVYTKLNSAVIAKEPQNEVALENRAQIYKEQGKNALAEKDLTAAINATPKPRFLVARSAVTKDSQPESALNDVTAALQIDPGNAEALTLRAKIYGKLKFTAKAIDDLNAAININPLDMGLLYQRAQAYIQLKKWDAALNDLENALEVQPNNAQFYLARAYVYHKQGNEALSQEDIKRAQFCDPTLPKNINLDGVDAARVTKGS